MNAPVNYDPQSEAWTTPLDQLDPGNPARFQDDTMWPTFARLRRDAPVHYSTTSPMFGPYWSVTKYKDIMAVEVNHKAFSSDSGFGGISIRDRPKELRLPMFIAMDPPRHDDQRKVVQPIVAPANLAKLEGIIRDRVCAILDGLPRGETFNWVEHVSIELTVSMLATLFDFPYEDRRKLSFWSDCATAAPEAGGYIDSEAKREEVFAECLAYFTNLWNQRVNADPRPDLISMLAHGEATRNMTPREYLGNLILLIVGGNDTTRNSMSAYALGLDQFPDERAKLEANPALIPNTVQELIRWQTPLAHMRRLAVRDTELNGHHIRAGDKVVLWYISANRDETIFEDADRIIIDRANARRHLAFGHGIHRCVGARLAELQIGVLLEEMAKRRLRPNVVGAPERVAACFVHGYRSLPVELSHY